MCIHNPFPKSRPRGLRWLPALLWLAVALSCIPARAHTPFLFLALEPDGQLRIETGFSDGSTGAGLPVEIRDTTTGEVVQTIAMPENGVARIVPPASGYTVTLNAGEGHKVTKPGPAAAPREDDPFKQPLLLDCHWGDAASLPAETQALLKKAKVVIAHEWLFERLRFLFTDQTVVLVDAHVPLHAADAGLPAESLRDAAKLRDTLRQRLHAAKDAAEAVAILCPTSPAASPDWAWLLEDELAAAWQPPAQP